jgi:hypothetical protein
VPFGSSNLAMTKRIKRRKTEETILIRNGQSSHFLNRNWWNELCMRSLREPKIQGCCGDRYAI